MDEVTGNTPPRPEVTAFTDYRAYLREMILFLKATQSSFSYRNFSRRAGFASPNFLKQVAEGHRNISHGSIAKFGRGLDLSERELSVFEALVLLEQANTDEERNRYYKRIRAAAGRAGSQASRIEVDQYDMYTDWYTLVTREFIASSAGDHGAESIARKLFPRIRPGQAKRALELLERLRLLTRNGAGRLRAVERTISTGPIVKSLAIRNFHRAMLNLAAKALDSVSRDQRNVTSLTVPLDAEKYARAPGIGFGVTPQPPGRGGSVRRQGEGPRDGRDRLLETRRLAARRTEHLLR